MSRPTESRVFDPAVLEQEFRFDADNALRELRLALQRGDVTVGFRVLQGVGSNDADRVHFHLSLDLGVRVVAWSPIPGATPVQTVPEQVAMHNLLHGRGLPVGVTR